MLSTLHIENIAVIERADIEFEPGLNLLTGETGAGKSIIIDALSAVLGMRASRDLIRTGCDSAKVSALFFAPGVAAERFAKEHGCEIESGGELLVSRELRGDGRNLCRVNGNPVTTAQLKELGALLANIHGQHDGQALLREDSHLRLLDAFGAVDTSVCRELYRGWRALEKERQSLAMDEEEKARRVDMLSYRLQEWDELSLEAGEEEALTARRNVLRDAGRIRSALETAHNALYGSEEEMGACDMTARADAAIGHVAGGSGDLAALSERLGELRYALADCASDLRAFWEDIEDSERELENTETRMDAIHRLCRKHNASSEALFSMAKQWREELSRLETGEERLRELEKEAEAALANLHAEAERLRERRAAAARVLEQRMAEELAELNMPGVRLAVQSEVCEVGSEGAERLRFFISANLGEALKPLSKIASGGEMSRIMLALKNLLTEEEEAQTLVFDEVDSGVSGRAAQRVAQKLYAVSRQKQVLCITHLPQMAAMADSHFHIEKEEADGRTVTRVTKLDREGRIGELARASAGAAITETALRSAEEMLSLAEGYKEHIAQA